MWVYQRSMVRIWANWAIASRYARTEDSVASLRSAGVSPLFRAAMVKLAAIRLTSHSNGPGRVSSKSLRSNTSLRSGEANAPKFDRCASPQSWASSPATGVSRQVGGHDLRRAAVEGEGRHRHPAVPDRHQVLLPGDVLLLQQGDRVRPVRRRHPSRVVRRRCRDPGIGALWPRSATLGWATFRTAIRYHFPPDVAPPGPGREPAPRARLTPERPRAGRRPI